MIWTTELQLVLNLTSLYNFVVVSCSCQGHSKNSSHNNSLTSSDKDFRDFIRTILPLPPDKRNVQMKMEKRPQIVQAQQAMDHRSVVIESEQVQTSTSVVRQKIEISSANTMLIGDYSSAVFSPLDARWLVQAQGNATFASILTLIKEDMIAVDRRYVFLQMGGNQVMTSDRQKIHSQVLELVVAIRQKNANSTIYFVGVLPRVVNNEEIKPFIMKFNRWLATSVKEVDIIFEHVRFLPVYLKFIEGNVPKLHLFDPQNSLLLSPAGAELFRQSLCWQVLSEISKTSSIVVILKILFEKVQVRNS